MVKRLGVVAQMLQAERVLVMLGMKMKEDIHSTVRIRNYQSLGLLKGEFFLEGGRETHNTHRRTIVEDRTAIPTKFILHVPVETFLK